MMYLARGKRVYSVSAGPNARVFTSRALRRFLGSDSPYKDCPSCHEYRHRRVLDLCFLHVFSDALLFHRRLGGMSGPSRVGRNERASQWNSEHGTGGGREHLVLRLAGGSRSRGEV